MGRAFRLSHRSRLHPLVSGIDMSKGLLGYQRWDAFKTTFMVWSCSFCAMNKCRRRIYVLQSLSKSYKLSIRSNRILNRSFWVYT